MSSYFTLVDAAGVSNTFEALGITIQKVTGISLPTPTNIATQNAARDGSNYQRSIVPARTITLVCVARAATLVSLHAIEKALVQHINRDVTTTQLPMYLRYNGSGTTYEIPVYYAGGVEVERDGLAVQRFALQLISYDPFWRGISDSTTTLQTILGVSYTNYIAKKSAAGTWSALGRGLDGAVWCIAHDPTTGDVYVGGAFNLATQSNGTTVACHGLARWNGTTWAAVGTGVSGGSELVSCIYITPTVIVIGGNFTAVNGVANCNNCAIYTRLSATWAPMGRGVNNTVRSITATRDGTTFFVGGEFTSATNTGGGTVSVAYMAKYTAGGGWAVLLAGGDPDALVYTLLLVADRYLYVGGYFTLAYGAVRSGVFRYDRTAGTVSSMGVGVSSFIIVQTLALASNGDILAGGAFQLADGSPALRVARWNGAGWFPFGTGLGIASSGDGSVAHIASYSDGSVVASGYTWSTAGGVTCFAPLAVWNGAAWRPEDAYISAGAPNIIASMVDASDNLYIGYDQVAPMYVQGLVTINNPGTGKAYPTITFSSSGAANRIWSLTNYTTKEDIFIGYNIADGEVLTLNLSPTARSFTSNLYGNVLSAMLRGSDYATWGLAPGNNIIGCRMDNSGTYTATLVFRTRNWSAD